MNAKCSIVCGLLTALGSGPVMAQEVRTPGAAEVRHAMFNAIAAIEEAAALDPRASQAISDLSDEAVETMFSSMANKEQFIASARRIVDRVDSARTAFPGDKLVNQNGETQSLLSSSGTLPFPPNYPSSSSVNFAVVLALGLVNSPDDRCDGAALDALEAVLAGAKSALAFGDAACTVAGCDPTGIACLAVCASVEAVKLAVLAADVPILACAAHGGNVDSAEIEAGFENTKSTLIDLAVHDDDLAAHDANIDADLAAHDARILNRLDILEAALTDILANQEEIIKLLKTPQGKRPGWNEGR